MRVSRREALTALSMAPTVGVSSPLSEAKQAGPFIHSRGALDRLRDLGCTVKDTGAIGDGLADDTAAIQELADYFGKRGGEWRVPAGIYRTTGPISIDCQMGQSIVGSGSRAVYPGALDPRAEINSTVIMPTHQGRHAIGFVGKSQGDGSIEVRNIALATLERGSLPIAAFGWDAGSRFIRDFRFLSCSIHGFTSAFDVYRTAKLDSQVGLFRAHYCRINRNRWIARTLDGTQWNGFDLSFCEAGQNGYDNKSGGICISAHNAIISGNCLEGMRDPIRIFGGVNGIDIRSNYFESNIGRALIWLDGVGGSFDIGPNTVLDADQHKLDHLVLLTHCGSGKSSIPYWPDVVHKLEAPIVRKQSHMLDQAPSGDDGFLRCDSPDIGGLLQRPNYLNIIRPILSEHRKEEHPVTGKEVAITELSMQNTDRLTISANIVGKVGEFVVVSFLMKRRGGLDSSDDPYLSINVNGIGSGGSRDYVIYRFHSWWRDGEWSVITAAIKLSEAMKNLQVSIYPFGLKPKVDRYADICCPVTYTTGSAIDVRPYVAPGVNPIV